MILTPPKIYDATTETYGQLMANQNQSKHNGERLNQKNERHKVNTYITNS